MNKYIFLTFEWTTYQPNSDSQEPDIENVQMLGTISWKTKDEAFENFKKENEWVLKTSFNEIYCHELKDDNFDYYNLK